MLHDYNPIKCVCIWINLLVYKHVLRMLFLVSFLKFKENSLKASKSVEFPVNTTATVNIKYKG